MTMAVSKKEKKEREAILQEARDRFAYATDADHENRKEAKRDLEFVWKKDAQWDEKAVADRREDGRPVLTINQLPQFIRQVVNDQRQARPGIRIDAGDDAATDDVAEIYQGLARQIEYESNAEQAYDNSFEYSVTSGIGFWRILTDYESPTSFNQKILIKRIADPDTVRFDPDYEEPDGSDISYAFVVEALTESEFKSRYPDAKPLSWEGADDLVGKWFDGEGENRKVIVADYYRRVVQERALYLLADGSAVFEDELPEGFDESMVLDKRVSEDFTVEWYKIAGGQQILKTYDWAGKYVPLIMCLGDVIVIDGKRYYQGIIRHSLDSQRLYNMSRTAIAEHMSLSPKAPFIVAEGQVKPYVHVWKQANVKSFAYLPYKPDSIAGTPVPPPQRMQPAVMPPGLAEQSMMCMQDLRSTTGIYDPQLGQKSNETSGKAILAREKQGDTGTFHYHDNLARAIAHGGRVIVDLIPKIYDTRRLLTLRNEDGTQKKQVVNEQQVDPATGLVLQTLNDLTKGKYVVSVRAGPSYATKRQEAAEFMLQTVQAFPPIMQVAGDLLMKAQDVQGADELAERMQMMLPPPIQQAIKAKEEKRTPPDPAMMAQMQQMQGQLQQAAQAVQQLQAENQQLKSGAMQKAQAQQAETALKAKALQDEQELERQKAEEELALERKKAEDEAKAVITKAMIDQQTKVQVAKIDRETKIAIAAIGGGGMRPAPKEEGEKGETQGEERGEQEEMQWADLPERMMQLAQGMQMLHEMVTAPKPKRRYKVLYDDAGEVLGAEEE